MIYLDHHATTPLDPVVREQLAALLTAGHGNPSSVHTAGRAVRARIETARTEFAAQIGANARDIVFTSGGTEAVHAAVRGVRGGRAVECVLVDPGAHPALRSACERLARELSIACENLPTDSGGAIRWDTLRAALARTRSLVAISWVQHETGAIREVAAVADLARASGGWLVLDGVQALGKLPVDVATTGALAVAFSAHKIGGPTGAGAVWIHADARPVALVEGGGQERGLRAGTENVLGAVGWGSAASRLPWRVARMPELARLRDGIERTVARIEGVVVNGTEFPRVATASHLSIRGVAGEELVAALDLEGFCVSSGPACSSGRPGPSASMRALYPDEPWRAAGALRISLGVETTDSDVAALADALPRIVQRVRG